MKKYICTLFLLSSYLLSAQQNLVKNGDFKITEGNYLSGIKRYEHGLEFGKVKDWAYISIDGLSAIAADEDVSKLKYRAEWDKEALIESQSKAAKEEVLIGLLVMKESVNGLPYREYLIGQLSRPLLKGKKYELRIRAYAPATPCYGLNSIGVKLEHFYPNTMDHSPREDTTAYNFMPLEQSGEWKDFSMEIKGKGDENFIIVGCFSPEEKLLLYQKYENKFYKKENQSTLAMKELESKKKCPRGFGQGLLLSYIGIEPLDTTEWGDLAPQGDSLLLVDTISILNKQDSVLEIKEQEKKYQILFDKNQFEIKEVDLEKLVIDIEQLKGKGLPYYLSIQGHTDQEGSQKANQLLSKKRAEAVLKVLKNRGLNIKNTNVNYFGEEQLKSADPAKNRRVEITIYYQADSAILD